MARTLKQTKTIEGSTSSSAWTWKQVISEYFDDDYITTNKSVVVVQSYIGVPSGKSTASFGGTATTNITCAGDSRSKSQTWIYQSFWISPGSWKLIQEETFTIEHNNDGKKTISVSSSLSTSDFNPNSASASGTMELTIIPRASEIFCSSPYIGDNAIISIDKKNSNFTNTLTYQIGSLTDTIVTKTSETIVQLNTNLIEDDIYALIPNAKEIQGTIYCTTYNGTMQIGDTNSTTFNLYAKETVCKPDISATITDTNTSVTDVMGSNTKFVKYISKPKVEINATAKKSASISNYSINLNDGQISGFQENTFDTIGSNKITVLATDTRSYSNSETYELDIVDYIKLHINEISITRSEGTSNEAILNCNGVYYNDVFIDEVSNSLEISFKYRLSGASEWIDGEVLTPTITNNTFEISSLSLGELFNYDEEYQFMLIFEDIFMIVNETVTLEKGQEVLAIGDDKVWVYGKVYYNENEIGYNTNNFNETTIDGYSCDYINKLHTYSSEEIRIGTYMGKPLYRKVFVSDSTSLEREIKIDLTDLSIGYIINAYGWVRSIYWQWWTLSNHYPTEAGYDTSMSYTIEQIGVALGSYFSYPPYRLIIEYTKSTDE